MDNHSQAQQTHAERHSTVQQVRCNKCTHIVLRCIFPINFHSISKEHFVMFTCLYWKPLVSFSYWTLRKIDCISTWWHIPSIMYLGCPFLRNVLAPFIWRNSTGSHPWSFLNWAKILAQQQQSGFWNLTQNKKSYTLHYMKERNLQFSLFFFPLVLSAGEQIVLKF